MTNDRDSKVVDWYNRLPQDWPHRGIQRIGWPANRSRFLTKMTKKRPCTQSGFTKKRTLEQKSCKKRHKHTKNQILASTQCLDFTRNTSWLANYFSFIKKPKSKFSLNLCLGNQSVIASVCIFDTIAASLSNILIWTSTCGSERYKRNIHNRKIQSKRVLGLMKYTHRLAYHNEVTQ